MDSFKSFRKRYKYDIDQHSLGGGSFGNVYKAWDTQLSKFVALKIVSYKNNLQSSRHSLQEEVEIARSIVDKTNIAVYEKCYPFKSDSGFVDVALMQFYESGNLKQFLQRNELTREVRERIIEGVINGLDEVHKGKIIHRDLKPENILIAVDPQGEIIPKIADFGFAKKSDAPDASHFSQSIIGGTIYYSSPEQLKEETEELRFNTDIWSLGVIMYEILIGENPFTQHINKDVKPDVRKKIILKRIKDAVLPDDIKTIGEPYQEIIEKAIIVDPETRIGSVTEIKNIIEKARPKPAVVPEELPQEIITPSEDLTEDDEGTIPEPGVMEDPEGTIPAPVVMEDDEGPMPQPAGAQDAEEPGPERKRKSRPGVLIASGAVLLILVFVLLNKEAIIGAGRSPQSLSDSIPENRMEVSKDSTSVFDNAIARVDSLAAKDSIERAILFLESIKAPGKDAVIIQKIDQLKNKRKTRLDAQYSVMANPDYDRSTDNNCNSPRVKAMKIIRALDSEKVTPYMNTVLQKCN